MGELRGCPLAVAVALDEPCPYMSPQRGRDRPGRARGQGTWANIANVCQMSSQIESLAGSLARQSEPNPGRD